MKKYLLIAFITLSTCVSCSSDDSDFDNTNQSFSHSIKDVKSFYADGSQVEFQIVEGLNEDSMIIYDKNSKTIKITGEVGYTFNIKSVKNEEYYSKLDTGTKDEPHIIDIKFVYEGGDLVMYQSYQGEMFLKVIFYL